MQDVSNVENFTTLLSENYSVETKVIINDVEYGEGVLKGLRTSKTAMDTSNPGIGYALAGQIELSMLEPIEEIPKGAQIEPYVRIFADTSQSGGAAVAGYAVAGESVVGVYSERVYSGWIPKGLYWISSRELDEETGVLTIYGYDVMRKADMVYPSSALEWSDSSPTAYEVLQEVAGFLDIEIDDRTIEAIPATTTYIVSFPSDYTLREVLESIGAMYGGSFCISDEGKLFYVGLTDIPTETYYLSTEDGDYITFGGTRILLQG